MLTNYFKVIPNINNILKFRHLICNTISVMELLVQLKHQFSFTILATAIQMERNFNKQNVTKRNEKIIARKKRNKLNENMNTIWCLVCIFHFYSSICAPCTTIRDSFAVAFCQFSACRLAVVNYSIRLYCGVYFIAHCSQPQSICLSIFFCAMFFLPIFFSRIFVWFAYECGANTNFIPLSAFTSINKKKQQQQHQKRNENIIRTKSHRGIFYAILSDEIMDLSGPFNKNKIKVATFFFSTSFIQPM